MYQPTTPPPWWIQQNPQLLLQGLHSVAGAQRFAQAVVEGQDLLPLHGPVEDAVRAQHAPAQEQRPGPPVVMHVLQEDQHHAVPALLDDLVEGVVDLEASTQWIPE